MAFDLKKKKKDFRLICFPSFAYEFFRPFGPSRMRIAPKMSTNICDLDWKKKFRLSHNTSFAFVNIEKLKKN